MPATTAPPTTAAPAPSAPPPLSLGDHGPAVLALQQRLTSLGYWLGTPDSSFSPTTEQAVYAFQKAAGIGRDGSVGPQTSAALAQGVVPHARSTS
ncbi:MAG TPA: peptidoglycan-binding domain-containing protein, partial [Acidimicrobiales bacterium]|nr:peptidoglycan-binding domain-containing protein [Acidimicrobiales bacterium]